MKMNGVFLLLLLHSVAFSLAQKKMEFDSIHYPLNIPIKLSGTFGELRSNHFHSGIDIKTKGVEGKDVVAIDDGYISRIKVSSRGFGKALYIDHPNGSTSVYAHLKEFSENIAKYIKSMQYANEVFEVDFSPNSKQFLVRKGEVIALSGNTGGSSGPHLHFEIRETNTQNPYNPLAFGILIEDDIRPIIESICIYAKNDTKRCFDVIKDVNKYIIRDTLLVFSPFSFSIASYDQHNEGYNKNGIYDLELLIDDSLIHKRTMNTFSFKETRYINSLIDYKEKECCQKTMQKCFIDPCNNLDVYSAKSDGWFFLSDFMAHLVEFKVYDYNGNYSLLTFYVKQNNNLALDVGDIGTLLYCNTINELQLENGEVELYFPQNSFYKDFYFKFYRSSPKRNAISPTFKIHDASVPVHKYYVLSLKAELPQSVKYKTGLVRFNNSDIPLFIGGSWSDNTLVTKLRHFGEFSLMIDTIGPVIFAKNISNGKNMQGSNFINFTITDNLSGISSYRGEIDQKWILMEYDAKSATLTYFFDESIQEGEHILTLIVEDKLKNMSSYEVKFIK